MKPRSILFGAAAIAAFALLAGGAALGWVKLAPRHAPAGQPPLAGLDVAALGEMRESFNAASGEVRILAMLSPT